MGKIAVVGSLNMDVSYRVAHIPAPGETILAQGVAKNPGGKGGNQAVAAAKMGAGVSMIGLTGDDADGEALRRSLAGAGVDTAFVGRCGEPTGTAFICVSDAGENNIVVHAGANACVDARTLAEADACLRAAEMCVVQLEIPHETAWQALRRCRELGVFTVLNPSPACPVPDSVLRGLDLLVPNETEMEALLPGALDLDALPGYAREKGVRRILMTLGDKGCCLATAEGVRRFPCTPVRAVDTTGAGDTFLGALCAMLAEGRALEEAIAIAQRAAAWAVTRPGAQQAMPCRENIL